MTPEREAEIRDRYKRGYTAQYDDTFLLLAEIDRLRAELDGALNAHIAYSTRLADILRGG